MRKVISYIILVFFQLTLISCSFPVSEDSVGSTSKSGINTYSPSQLLTTEETDDLKLVAWNYLVEKELTKTIIHEYSQSLLGESTFNNIETITITFSTIDDALLGPIVVHINEETKEVIGIAKRF